MILIFLCILFFLLPYNQLISLLAHLYIKPVTYDTFFLSSILEICLYQCFNVFIKVHNIRFQTESMPIIKKKWQTKFVTGYFPGSFDWLVKTNSNRNIVRYKEVYRVKRALVKTSVIARQKYDYIYFNSIPLSNIS